MLMIYLPLILARHFASVFVLFGSSFFWFYMRNERWLSGPGGFPAALRATTILLRIAAPIAAVSGVAWLACILINISRDFGSIIDPEDLWLYFFETPFGTVPFARLALLAAAVLVAAMPWANRACFSALLHIGTLLLITQAWFGHAAEGRGLYRAMVITVYGVHALATAAWVGGLPLVTA
jgi:putative copper resistance protein D